MERYRWPTVANSWPRGMISSGLIGGIGGPAGWKPSASVPSIPSGRSRYTKCCNAVSPNGSSRTCTPGG